MCVCIHTDNERLIIVKYIIVKSIYVHLDNFEKKKKIVKS